MKIKVYPFGPLQANSYLVIFENDGHYAYWNQLSRFHAIVSVFLEEDASHV